MIRRAWILAVLVTLVVGTPGEQIAGAGAPSSPGRDNFVTAVTIRGGGLDGEVTTSIHLTTSMSVGYGETRLTLPPESFDLRRRTERPLRYAITLHYDLTQTGWGEYDREGFFDGVNVLHFPEPMTMGNGVWAAGFYRASPDFAVQLQAALSAAITPPSTGDAGLVP